ncbi:cytosylglucuronate decarboxylase [Glycomyces rhizosphaerae]|uniref:Cytosylglucuronate decarboxylase n=1 Tax=Glycomyces rhizosphaerae TaxID=2054422 RepID=A0ABV7Q8B0_9ACTN
MEDRKYLFVRVLEACNADCFFCGFALSRDRYRLQPDELAGILAQAAEMGVGHVRFTGGEPLMHREILPLVRVGAALPAKVSLITNGLLLPRMAEELAEAGLDQVIVSIDSGFAEQHNEYRNTPNLFEKAFEGIAEARRHRIRVRVNTVVGPHNYQSMPELAKTLRDAGVEQWELSALKLSDQITYPDREDVVRVAEAVYEGDGLIPMGKRWFGDTPEERDQYFERGIPPRSSGDVCRVTDDVMYLDPKEGYLFPCSLLPHRSTPVLYGAQVRNDDGSFTLDSPTFRERRLFFRENGANLCTGCSSSAAGYSDRAASGTPQPSWSY